MNQANTQVHLRMRHADVAGLGWVSEDVVTSLHIPQLPAISFEHLDDLLAVHGGYNTHQPQVVNTIPTQAVRGGLLLTNSVNPTRWRRFWAGMVDRLGRLACGYHVNQAEKSWHGIRI